jgi:hypothetical protein
MKDGSAILSSLRPSNKMYKSLLFLLPVVAVFLSHYVAANAYAAICTPLSLEGLLWSFFTTSSPVCNLLLGIVTYSSSNYGMLMAGLLVSGVGLLGSLFTTPTPQRAASEGQEA